MLRFNVHLEIIFKLEFGITLKPQNSRIGHIEDRIYKNIPITFAAGLKTTLASRELCS